MSKTLEPQQDKSGYYRQIGYKREGSRSQPKFRLGKDRVQAIERLAKIVQLWQWKCEQHPPAIWGPFEDVAKAIGRGEKQYLVTADRFNNPVAYHEAIFGLGTNPVIEVVPEDDTKQVVGKALMQAIGKGMQLDAKAKQAVDNADTCEGFQAIHLFRDRCTNYLTPSMTTYPKPMGRSATMARPSSDRLWH